MSLYCLGYERKDGMTIEVFREGEHSETIEIGTEEFNQMAGPSRVELRDRFLNRLTSDDIVLSPGGSNYLLLDAVFRRTPNVGWIPSQYLDEQPATKVLYNLWQEKPEEFHKFREPDQITRRVKTHFDDWMQVEKERVSVSNAYSQLLRRIRDGVVLLDVSEEEFVEDYIAKNKGLAQGLARSLGHRPNLPKVEQMLQERGFEPEEIETIASSWDEFRSVISDDLVESLETEARKLYRAYTNQQISEQERKSRERGIKQRRLQYLNRREEQLEKEVEEAIQESVLSGLYEDLSGVGTRILGGMITHIRSPLLYKDVNGLLAYFNLLPYKGRRRTRTEAAKQGGARFDAETLMYEWSNQPAFFSNDELTDIYRSYKLWRWLVYHPLYEMSQEVFNLLPKSGSPDVSKEKIRDIARRIFHLRNEIPMIRDNKEVRRKLKYIWGTGSPKELKSVLKRYLSKEVRVLSQVNLSMKEIDYEIAHEELGNPKVKEWAKSILGRVEDPKLASALKDIRGTGNWDDLCEVVLRRNDGHNIQMPLSRLERIARREVTIELAKKVFYDWLRSSLEERISSEREINTEMKARFKEDGNYLKQDEFYTGNSQIPVDFSLSTPAAFYAYRAKQTAKEKGYESLNDIPKEIVDSCGEEHITGILNL